MPAKKTPSRQCSFFLSLTPDLTAYFRKQLRGCPAHISTEPLALEKLDPATNILGVFVDSQINPAAFARLPKLRLIATFSTGYDHIDLKTARRRGVTVCNVPNYGEQTVAEHALTLMLALAKNLFLVAKRVKEGTFDYHGLRGFDLGGKTIGVMGTGRIGARLIRLLHGFGVSVLAYDTQKNASLVRDYGVKYVAKAKLFHDSDIISLHLPLLPGTRHLINKPALKQMKRGVYLINTARGGLIDPSALVWGLESGLVAGAGLDVLEEENLLAEPMLLCAKNCPPQKTAATLMNNILIDHPRTIITPHTAFNTEEAVRRILDTSAKNIKAFLEGKPQNVVA